MKAWSVIVTALGQAPAQPDDACRRLKAAWTGARPADFSSAPGDALPAMVRSTDGVVLLAQRTATQSAVLPMLEMLAEAGIPVLALLDGAPDQGNVFEYGGALAEELGSDDARLCALLQGMLHRHLEVKALRAEASLNQRFHGGLKGQITKMHEELQLAALVQREFLPREVPSMHGVEFATLWRPTNYVSGDIFDLVRLDEDHVGVFVADAVGHGVPAALMTMVICRSLVPKEITGNTYRIVPPSEVLTRLNAEMIRRQGRNTRFSTAVYALVNCRQRTMLLAGAGHPPPVRLRADGSSEPLESPGGLLGVFPDERYDQIEVEIALDDRILFYTDGFEQAFPAAPPSDNYERRLPTNRYRAEFEQLARLPSAQDMVDVISRRLDDQSGSLHQVDDLTLIVLHAGSLAAGVDSGSAARSAPANRGVAQST